MAARGRTALTLDRRTLDMVPIAAAITNRRDELRFVNAHLASLYGVPARDLIGLSPCVIAPQVDHDVRLAMERAVRATGQPQQRIEKWTRPSGTTWQRCTRRLVSGGGMLAIGEDMSGELLAVAMLWKERGRRGTRKPVEAVEVDGRHRLAALGMLVRLGATVGAASTPALDEGSAAVALRLFDEADPKAMAASLAIEPEELAARCIRVIRASRAQP